jgi:hypothetical protein
MDLLMTGRMTSMVVPSPFSVVSIGKDERFDDTYLTNETDDLNRATDPHRAERFGEGSGATNFNNTVDSPSVRLKSMLSHRSAMSANGITHNLLDFLIPVRRLVVVDNMAELLRNLQLLVGGRGGNDGCAGCDGKLQSEAVGLYLAHPTKFDQGEALT